MHSVAHALRPVDHADTAYLIRGVYKTSQASRLHRPATPGGMAPGSRVIDWIAAKQALSKHGDPDIQTPNVLHPSRVVINGYTFQVVTFMRLTDAQASKIARHYYLTHRLTKNQQRSILKIVSVIDESGLANL